MFLCVAHFLWLAISRDECGTSINGIHWAMNCMPKHCDLISPSDYGKQYIQTLLLHIPLLSSSQWKRLVAFTSAPTPRPEETFHTEPNNFPSSDNVCIVVEKRHTSSRFRSAVGSVTVLLRLSSNAIQSNRLRICVPIHLENSVGCAPIASVNDLTHWYTLRICFTRRITPEILRVYRYEFPNISTKPQQNLNSFCFGQVRCIEIYIGKI